LRYVAGDSPVPILDIQFIFFPRKIQALEKIKDLLNIINIASVNEYNRKRNITGRSLFEYPYGFPESRAFPSAVPEIQPRQWSSVISDRIRWIVPLFFLPIPA
jgi:hypothetical protein